MMKNPIVFREAKSQLARLMANENLTVEHRAVSTASFDVESRVLTLPVWKEMTGNIYDTLVGHEIGHALDTPMMDQKTIDYVISFDPSNVKGVKHFWNVIEDARIEKIVRRRYPGMRRCFSLGYNELYDRGFFGKPSSLQNMNLIDRINMHFKLGAMANIMFLPEEQPLIKMVEDCETFEEAIEATRVIYAYCKQHDTSNSSLLLEDFFDQFEKSDSEYYDDEDGSYQSDTVESFDDEQGQDSSDEEGDGQDQDSSGEESGNESDASSSDADETDNQSSAPKTDQGADTGGPTSETNENWEKNQEKLNSLEKRGYQYVNIPHIDHQKFVIPYKTVLVELDQIFSRLSKVGHIGYTKVNGDAFLPEARAINANKFRSENMPVISYMVKEFEMRKSATAHARSSISKTGVLNTNKLHSYKYNDDIFRRITNVPVGKNHGLVMFIDWSSSMSYNMSGTIDQLLNLVFFCKRVHIPFEVYAFSDHYYEVDAKGVRSNVVPAVSYEKNDMMLNRLNLFQFFSSSMNVADFNRMVANLSTMKKLKDYLGNASYMKQYALNGTPLNSTIILASSVIDAFREKTKSEIVNTIFLTDGGNSGSEMIFDGDLGYRTKNIIFRDKKTKCEYHIGDMRNHVTTESLLLNLRQRTNCDVIGFHIVSHKREAVRAYDPYHEMELKDHENLMKEFGEKNSLTSVDRGYSLYFIIKDGDNLRVNYEEFDIKQDSSVRKIASQFSKFTKNKLENRVVLNRFIQQIA